MKKSRIGMSFFLVLIMLLTFAVPAFAEELPDSSASTIVAESVSEYAETEPVDGAASEAEDSVSSDGSEAEQSVPEESADTVEQAPALPDFALNPVVEDDAWAEPGSGLPQFSDENAMEEAVPGFEELTHSPRARNYYQLETTMAQTGNLSASNSMDYYFYDPPATGRFLIFRISSSNANVRFGLYTMDWNTGNLSAIGAVAPNNNGYICLTSDIVSSVPSFALVAYTLDGSAATYTAYAHATNPANSGNVVPVYTSSTLADVTVIDYGQTRPYLYTNGSDILDTTIEYKRERTNNFNWGYHSVNASMQVKRNNIASMYIGSFSNSRGTSIPANSALYIEAGTGSFWSFYISQYVNNGGDVTREMDWHDITGQLTPRYISGSGGFIVVDMRTNQVVDHVGGGLSYWYRSEVGETCSTNYSSQIW